MSSHLVRTLTNFPHLLKLDLLVGDIIDLNLFGFCTRIISCPSPSFSTNTKEITFNISASLFFPFSNSGEIHFHLHSIIPFRMRTTTNKVSPKLSLLLLKRQLSLSSFSTYIFLFCNLALPNFLLPFPLVFLFEVRRTTWVVSVIEVSQLVYCHYGRINSFEILSP